jgi:hypothetical protein
MLQGLKRWWQVRTRTYDTPFDNEVPFWIVSLTFHLVLLILMAKILIPSAEDRKVQLLAVPDEAAELEQALPEVSFNPLEQAELGADSLDAADLAAEQTREIEMELEQRNPVEVAKLDSVVGELLLNDAFDQASADNLQSLATKGTVGQAVAGAAGAVDRITQEILLSLDERPTLVVWLFDQSASLMQQREEIAQRFERVYSELQILAEGGADQFKKHRDEPLLTQVYAFGSTFNRMLKEPTNDIALMQEAISRIERDDTGIEYVFSAVLQSATDFQKLRKVNRLTGERERNVMIIVVSDEAGDDVNRLDECATFCSKLEIPVYVVGVPAPFGREETRVRWVDPDPEFDQTPQWALVSQGPETVMPERVDLDYVGGGFEEFEEIDSGFGPFGLTRLAYETGGIYFAVHPNREIGRAIRQSETANYSAYLRYFFDPEVMRRYKPDYVSRQTYLERLMANKCRQSLVQAAQVSRIGALQPPLLVFPKLDEAAFTNAVSQAQRAAALLEPKMNQMFEILKLGEQDRDQEISPRWRAGYDLAYGRVLAGKVRAEAYNGMLAIAKTKLKFADEKNNTWVLQPADSIETGSQAKTLAEKAQTYLQRVMAEHPGTPWAMMAEKELANPMGWTWKERFTPPPEPPQMAMNPPDNPPPGIPNVPQPQPLAMPKPKRPPPKL